MKIREAIKIHNELKDNEAVLKYLEALHIVIANMHKKPDREFYKETDEKLYYIELPYKELTFDGKGNAIYRKHYFDGVGKYKNGSGEVHFCLSLCKYNKKEIEERIERDILEDKERYYDTKRDRVKPKNK